MKLYTNIFSAEAGTELARAFADLNEPFLSTAPRIEETVISFSHFLPRQELCPEKRFLIEPMLSKVIGSDYLRRQVFVSMHSSVIV